MSVALWYGLTGVVLFSVGLCGAALGRHLVRRLLAVNIMGSGVFLLLVAGAHGAPGRIDPVPHAMVLTGIVVAVSATALALALGRRAGATGDRDDPS